VCPSPATRRRFSSRRTSTSRREIGGSAHGEITDEELLRRFLEGGTNAFSTLVDRYKRRVHRFVCGYSRRAGREAEDLSQEVFLQVYRRAASFEARSRLSTWIFGIARNVCRHHARRGSVMERTKPDDDASAAIPDVAPGPLECLERQELRDAIDAALAELSPEQRATLLLREWEGLSYEEIAEATDVPLGTVRSRLHAARAALAARLCEHREQS
jgi:RNA polymerase sigma-70 factor (ECF subfamily)